MTPPVSNPFFVFDLTVITDSVGSRGFDSPVGGKMSKRHTRTHTRTGPKGYVPGDHKTGFIYCI